jgi:hypothetical protein
MNYFLIANGGFLAVLGLIMFYCYQKTKIKLARIGMILFIIGAAQIFWFFFWGSRSL